uniref:Uncharacterized protein n=1 Tax=Romanomermis culicivorax TaxID=13658 RepID=A0A915IDE1_ROMCU
MGSQYEMTANPDLSRSVEKAVRNNNFTLLGVRFGFFEMLDSADSSPLTDQSTLIMNVHCKR